MLKKIGDNYINSDKITVISVYEEPKTMVNKETFETKEVWCGILFDNGREFFFSKEEYAQLMVALVEEFD